jgi:hypothetical protein
MQQHHNRPLSSFPLPPSITTQLTKRGFVNDSDVINLSTSNLSKGRQRDRRSNSQ